METPRSGPSAEKNPIAEAVAQLFAGVERERLRALAGSLPPDLRLEIERAAQGSAPSWLTWLAQAHLGLLLVRQDTTRVTPALTLARWILGQLAPSIKQAPSPWQIHFTGLRLNLGTVLMLQRQSEQALAEFQAAAQGFQDLAPHHPDLIHPSLLARMNLATVLAMQGRLPEAADRYREVADYCAQMIGWAEQSAQPALLTQARQGFEPLHLEALFNLGKIQTNRGAPAEALTTLGRAVQRCQALVEEGQHQHRHLLALMAGTVGEVHQSLRHPDEAFHSYRQAVQALEPEVLKGRLDEIPLLCRAWTDALRTALARGNPNDTSALVSSALKVLQYLRGRSQDVTWAFEILQPFLQAVLDANIQRPVVEPLTAVFTKRGAL